MQTGDPDKSADNSLCCYATGLDPAETYTCLDGILGTPT